MLESQWTIHVELKLTREPTSNGHVKPSIKVIPKFAHLGNIQARERSCRHYSKVLHGRASHEQPLVTK